LKKILIATTNEGKKKEFLEALKNCGLESTLTLMTLNDIKTPLKEVEENGDTFEQNALLKARYYYEATGIPTLADDSGLVVPSLNGEPGVFSARYAGVPANSTQNMKKLLDKMQNSKDRFAYFITVLIFMPTKDQYYTFKGYVEGEITQTPKGEQGFGYDPIFYLPTLHQHMAELSLEQKQAISHRGKAIMEFLPLVKNWAISE
jgi:XTP/dITP diphosphohydrolase